MADPRARILITADDRASKVVRSLRREVSDTAGVLRSFASGFIGAFSFAAIGKGVVDVALQTEKLRASLETVTGSAGKANAAFDQIKRFTTETPFQVNEVADAFIKLAAYGIEPTEGLLRSLGNTASAMGKTLDQAVEALADAATGEFERLKEFGIKASSEGDKVAFTFRGVTTTVGKNADEITAYLKNIGETDFAGAMDRQMSTLGGAFSNLQDSVFNLADKFASESGLTNSIKAATKAITDLINEANSGELAVTKFGKGVGYAIGNLVEGQASVAGARMERIEELEDLEARLENQIRNKRSKRAAEEKAELQQRLDNVRSLIAVLKSSLNDPEFQELNRAGLIKRLPEASTQAVVGSIVPKSSGGGGVDKDAQRRQKDAMKAAKREAEEYARSLQSLRDQLDPASAEARKLEESIALLNRAFFTEGDLGPAEYDYLMQQLTTNTEALREAEKKLADDRAKAFDLIKGLDPGSTYRDQIAEVQRLRDTFPELSDSLAEVELELQAKWDEIGKDAKDTADEAKEAWQGLGPIMTSAFEDAVIAGAKFSDLLKGLEADLIRLFTRNLVTKPLESFFSPGGSGGDFLSQIFGGLFGGARAGGGPVASGRAYLVGEEGPELFMPRGAGEIIPAKQTRNMAGNQIVTININGVSDYESFRRNDTQLRRAAQRALAGA